MSGHDIVINGRPVVYLTAGDPLKDPANVVGYDLFEDRQLSQHPRVRRIVTTLIRPIPRFYGVLHWSDGTDLSLVDAKVCEGTATDADFAGALAAEPHTIVCPHCDAQLRVLAVDPGQAVFASTLPERLRAHKLLTNCPICDGHLTVQIVEFLDQPDTE